MEARIQEALDDQWDALESRNPSIKRVRRRLAGLLEEFALQKQEEAVLFATQIDETNTRINALKKAQSERNLLQEQLDRESDSPLVLEISKLSAEVLDLDKQISELQAKRAEVDKRRREAESIHSSRSAKFRDSLAEFDRRNAPGEFERVNGLQSEVGTMERHRRAAEAEKKAARDGHEMWSQVVHQLAELDADLKGLKRDQLDRISFLLKSTSTSLEALQGKAQDYGWSVIVVAIGQELAILREALDMLGNAERESN